jgi:hypothetical protein
MNAQMERNLAERLAALADPSDDSDWDAVRTTAATLRERRPLSWRCRVVAAQPAAKRRWALRASLGAAVAVAVAFAVVSLVPGGKGCGGVLACAAAAIGGDGPIVHMTFAYPGLSDTSESWYDTESGIEYWRSPDSSVERWLEPSGDFYLRKDGKVTRLRRDVRSIDESVVKFFGRYERELASGNATLVGEATFEGQEAYVIDLPFDDPVSPGTGEPSRVKARVWVDRDSYQPLAFALSVGGHILPRLDPVTQEPSTGVDARIVSAQFEQREPGMFDVPKP